MGAEMSIPKPEILIEGYTRENLEKFKTGKKIWKVVDIYKSQLVELFEIKFPALKFSPDYKTKFAKFLEKYDGDLKGNWVYFPWNGCLIHMVSEKDFQKLRTNRNQDLITEDEQKKLLKSCVAVCGLSVGGSIAVSLAYSGIGQLKLTDFDNLSTSNLNRVRAGVHQIGESKSSLVSRQIYEANPYANLIVFDKGLNKNNLQNFLSRQNPEILFDEIDDFEMKIRLRMEAKKRGIPVLMVTNLGDGFLVDIERYDIDKNIELFNGLLGGIPEEILSKPIGEKEKIKYAIEIVGMENIPTRALQSLLKINKTLVGRPQLGNTVTASSGIAAYLVRKLLLGEDLPSGRHFISFDKLFNLDYNDEKRKEVIKITKGLLNG